MSVTMFLYHNTMNNPSYQSIFVIHICFLILKLKNMSVRFKVIKRGEPGVAGGGRWQYYAKAVMQGEANIYDLTRSIEQTSTVSGADIRAVLYALVDAIKNDLAEGRIVRMGDLGSLRVSISSEGRATAGEVHAGLIQGARFIFTPGPLLKTTLQSLSYQKV